MTGVDLRHVGDVAHIAATLMLLRRVASGRNSWGVSRRTQDLYFLVFALRYVDLLWDFHSLFNVAVKVLYLTSSIMLCTLLRWHTPAMHDHTEVVSTLTVCGLSACLGYGAWLFEAPRTPFELAWKISIALEAFAMVPQLTILARLHVPAPPFFASYLCLMAAYRGLYLAHWLWEVALTGRSRHSVFVWVMTVLQNIFFADVVIAYVTTKAKLGITAPVKIGPTDGHEQV